MACFDSAGRGQFGGNPAAPQHHHAVADLSQLFGVGTRAKHARAGGSGVTDRLINRLPRANIDALGRFVQQDQLRAELQPLRQNDLLLVAAAERCQRQHRPIWHNSKTISQLSACRQHRAAPKQEGPEPVGQRRQRHIVHDRQRADTTRDRPIPRDQHEASLDRGSRRKCRQVEPFRPQHQRAVLRLKRAVEQIGHLLVAGAQAGR